MMRLECLWMNYGKRSSGERGINYECDIAKQKGPDICAEYEMV